MTDARARRNGTDASTRFRPTMADVRHSHPEAREAFGAVFQRGPAVTDGGRPEREADDDAADSAADDAADSAADDAADAADDVADAADDEEQDDSEQSPDEEAAARAVETMRDLEHTPPYGDDVDAVWERGREE